MRVEADFDRCEGHGVCMATLPEIFQVDDEGYLNLLTEDVRSDQDALVRLAVERCPTRALKLTP